MCPKKRIPKMPRHRNIQTKGDIFLSTFAMKTVVEFAILVFAICQASVRAADDHANGRQTIACDCPQLVFAPYVWKRSGVGKQSRAEAAMPGAYLRALVTNTSQLSLLVDGTPNAGCPPHSMPVIEYSVDHGEFHSIALTRSDGAYAITVAEGLNLKTVHVLEVDFRAADLAVERWRGIRAHLVVAGLQIDAGGSVQRCPQRSRFAIAFGDSITEGVGVDGLFKSWQELGVNNARTTWFPLVAAALDCEYGQLGSGGQGLVLTHELPPLADTWDRFDPKTSRLQDGRLTPEPDYMFCAMGTNDPGNDITSSYIAFLKKFRKACPQARMFCIIPPLGVHADEVAAAVRARNAAGDARVHLIDLLRLREYFRAGQGATQLAYDGVHPSVLGQAMLATEITNEVQKVISANK
jgi:lysophospholipase L1-like esterase